MRPGKLAFTRRNDGHRSLSLWLEPWCDEFDLPPGSTVELFLRGSPGGLLEIEEAPKQVTVWAPSGSLVDIYIDGHLKESGSSSILVPDLGVLGTKGFVDVVFGNFPEARPGGRPRSSDGGWRAWLRKIFC